ncbi:hypothetical protein [Streptomyces sp. NPDC054863]
MHAPLRRVVLVVKDVLYGVNAGHAIRHGTTPHSDSAPTLPNCSDAKPSCSPTPSKAHGGPVNTAAFLAYLDGRQVRWRLTLDARLEAADPDPRAQLLAVFDALRDWADSAAGGMRSNAFVQAQFELAGPTSPSRAVVTQHKRALRRRMLALAEATGTPDPGFLVDQLLLIYEGTVANHSLGNIADPADKAHRTARRLIAAATPQPLDAFWA